uniref:Potassium/proton antiporter CemA n=1 Tax=Tetrabaena socialis TaxID=47790 RepID=A0A1B1FK97_9CHLO|nr:envelope membrane protein [Tetrabaena socialis]
MITRKNKNEGYTDKDKVVSITYEEIGLFPRSFSRVLDRFLKQLFSDVDNLVIQEYRFYRYLFLTTIKTIFILFFVPFLVNFAAKNYVVKPITEYFWNTSHPEIFLNSYEQKRAFAELEKFEEKIYFETLVLSQRPYKKVNFNDSPGLNFYPSRATVLKEQSKNEGVFVFPEGETRKNKNTEGTNGLFISEKIGIKTKSLYFIGKNKEISKIDFAPLYQRHKNDPGVKTPAAPLGAGRWASAHAVEDGPQPTYKRPLFLHIRNVGAQRDYDEKTIELATYYNNHSIEAITNFFADLLSLCTLLYLLITLSIQINITKSFLLEVFFGLDDSKKSLLILLITDLLVGYHSSNLWELFFEFIFNHYGIPESQTGIFLLVATLPVLLDVLFKYLIFRHLNRSSPATVATYQAIIE